MIKLKEELDLAKQFALSNGASDIIKNLLRKNNCSVQDLAKVLGIKPQSLSTKLYRDKFTFLEFQMIIFILESEMAIYNNGQRVY